MAIAESARLPRMNAPLPAYELTPAEAAQVVGIERKVVPGRSCGSCSLCCKVVSIELFDKPAGQWCSHAKPGKGCGIHRTRPFVCQSAFCEWMIAKGLGDEWKPERAKFAIFVRNDGNRLTAHVDPGSPNAWKREPYYTNFKRWAAEGALKRPVKLIDIMIGERLIVVLPDRDVEFGVLAAGEAIAMTRYPDGRLEPSVVKLAAANVREPACV
jgi:hypothetical protein